MKKITSAVLLTLLLSTSIFAGEIPTSGYTPPPPPPPQDGMQVSTTTPGEIPTSGLTYQIADTSLDLIQMLLGFGM